MLDGIKESLVIVGGETRVGKGYFLKYMVPVQQLMVKAMSELGISRSFYKGPDEQGQGSHFHIKEAKSTIPCVSVQNSFVWFLKLVLI